MKEEDIPDVISGETESLSEFLSMTAEVKKDTSDAFMNEKRGDMQEICSADDVTKMKIVNKDEDNNILIPTFKHLQTFPLEDGLTTHAGIKPPSRLKPLASVCAKSSNSVGSKPKKRKVTKS